MRPTKPKTQTAKTPPPPSLGNLERRIKKLEQQQAELSEAIYEVVEQQELAVARDEIILEALKGLENQVKALVNLSDRRGGSSEERSGPLASPLAKMQETRPTAIDANARAASGQQRGRGRGAP